MHFKIFMAIKIGYILVTEIKKAAKDKHITIDEGMMILSKVLKILGISISGPF